MKACINCANTKCANYGKPFNPVCHMHKTDIYNSEYREDVTMLDEVFNNRKIKEQEAAADVLNEELYARNLKTLNELNITEGGQLNDGPDSIKEYYKDMTTLNEYDRYRLQNDINNTINAYINKLVNRLQNEVDCKLQDIIFHNNLDQLANVIVGNNEHNRNTIDISAIDKEFKERRDAILTVEKERAKAEIIKLIKQKWREKYFPNKGVDDAE